jgi:tRNA G18 (ribose-2'-O)-methylase SpoU
MRGYFGIGIEGVSKVGNVGALMRTAHAFGASFMFTVAANYSQHRGASTDTSDAPGQVPFYSFPNIESMVLPHGSELVGIELIDEAIELPSFHHPRQAVYVLGRERGSLSPEMLARCRYVLRIPTAFCVNVGIAGALVMYDRTISQGRFAPRPVATGGPVEAVPEHVHGDPKFRADVRPFAAPLPRHES